MKLEKTEKIIKTFSTYLHTLISILGSLINITITFFLVIGSGCSMILLYKLYPKIGLEVFSILFSVFNFLYYFGITFILIILVVLILTGFFYLIRFFILSDIRRKERKEKFVNEIVDRLKKRRTNGSR